jgi:hypothetical protein
MFESARTMFNGVLSGGWWLLSLPRRLTRFFSSPSHQYPDNEAGLLMRRYMAHQSWFDSLSHWWFKKSFFSKTLIFFGATLASATLGILVGASTLFALTAGLLMVAGDMWLSSHEEHRRAGAELLAKETLGLNQNLNASQGLMERAVEASNFDAANLRLQADAIAKQVERIDTATKVVEVHNKKLTVTIASVSKETDALVARELIVTKGLAKLSADLDLCNQAIADATKKTVSAGEAMARIQTLERAAHPNQEPRSLGFFTTNQEKTTTSSEFDAFLDPILADIDAAEARMASWPSMIKV